MANGYNEQDSTCVYRYEYDSEKKDRLISVKTTTNGSESATYFAYDVYGNPVKYQTSSANAANNMFWTRGNLLAKYKDVEFSYDGTGLLFKKKKGNTTTNYIYENDKLLAVYDNDAYMFLQYDLTGMCGARVFNTKNNKNSSKVYTFIKSPDGAIREVRHDNVPIITYTYDAFGKPQLYKFYDDTEDDIEILCSVAWKCHVYDETTGFYYIDGNFYDPNTGRFINFSLDRVMDGIDAPGGINGYVYAGNNQVMSAGDDATIDSDVELVPYSNVKLKTWWDKVFAWWNNAAWWIKALIGVAVIAILLVLTVATSGAASCLFGTMLSGAIQGAVIGALSGAILSGIFALINHEDFWTSVLDGAAVIDVWQVMGKPGRNDLVCRGAADALSIRHGRLFAAAANE